MVVLAWKQGSRLAQGRAIGDLYLRIVGSARQGQIVRLSAPKCTIGSAEGCTLRLRAAGVRPLHCIILRGSRGTAIRSWARDTRLNGQPFGDSLLVPGDRLSVGPIEFDVIDGTACAETMSSQPSQNERSTIVRSPAQSPQSSGRSAHVDRGRARKLVAAVKQLRAEITELQSRPSAPPQDGSALDSARAELETRIAEFRQERDKWEATRQGTQSALEARDRKLVEELAELAATRDVLCREQESVEEARARESRDQNELAENLRRVQEELRLARDAFEQQRGAWAMENAQFHARLEQEQAELARERETAARILQEVEHERDRRQVEFQSQLEELEREQQDWKVRRTTEESRLAAEQSDLEWQREEILREKNELQLALAATQQERDQTVADLASQRQLWVAERTESEHHLAEQTSLVARQQAEQATLRDELDELGRQVQARQADAETRQAETDRAAAEAQVAAEEVRHRGADFEARQAAAWRELDRQRTQIATLDSVSFELPDDLHVRAAELEAGRREVDRQSESLTAERTDLERQAAELAQRETCLAESVASQAGVQSELNRARSELDVEGASIEEACLAVQQQAEVLEAQRRAIDEQREMLEQSQSETARQSDTLAESLAVLQTQRDALAAERQTWEAKQIEAEEGLTSRTAELDAREQALATQSAAATETVVNVPPVEDRDLEARRTQFEHERQAWHEAREQGDAEYDSQLERFEEQLEALRRSEAELESQRNALAQEQMEHEQCSESLRELAAELEAKEKELFANKGVVADFSEADVARADALNAQQADIELARGELDCQRDALERQREESEAEHNHARARIEHQRTELEAIRNELEESRAQFQTASNLERVRNELVARTVEEVDRDLTDQDDSSAAAEAADPEVVDIHEQEQMKEHDSDSQDGDVKDSADEQKRAEEQGCAEEQDSVEEDEVCEKEEAPVASVLSRSQRSDAANASADEESIDDYMAALLDRMRGGEPAEVVVAPQPKRNKRKSDPVPAEQRSTEDAAIRDVTSGHVVDMPMGAAELARRTPPVEKTDLSAMRELANTQASIAITRFGKKQLLQKAVRDCALGLLCMTAALFVLVVGPESDVAARTGSMLGLAAGVYWLFTGLVATKHWIAIGQRHKKGRAPKNTEI